MEEPTGDALFFDYLPKEARKRAGASLAELTGTGALPPAPLRSYVNVTTERAWSKPMARLTCEEVRLLSGGDERVWHWLARPVAEFVRRYPAAEITFFPGDLTMQALRAFPKIAEVDAAAARLLRDADLSWAADYYSSNRSLAREAAQLVEAAKTATI
ncbi:MAG TPA: hypothetical protein VM308_01430 [Sphingomicrobium sp.]|nr:hypothetical protein [Sphingomicrobium sp.]HVM38885.1 hypothetical protein [Sphingomicrobium sp.]